MTVYELFKKTDLKNVPVMNLTPQKNDEDIIIVNWFAQVGDEGGYMDT